MRPCFDTLFHALPLTCMCGCDHKRFAKVILTIVLHLHLISFVSRSPVSPITNVLPLSMVLFVSLVKEAWEDWVSYIRSLASSFQVVIFSPRNGLRI